MRANERYGHTLSSQPTTISVLVNLDALFPPPRASATVAGLQLRGWAPGALKGWERSDTGEWIGVVTFLIQRGDGSTFRAENQLVPAGATRADRVGADNPVASCILHVFVDEAAEPVSS
jgi:hypothetical protein